MPKPKLFVFGACDLHDIVKHDFLHRDFDVVDYHVNKSSVDNTILDFENMSMPESGTSIISLYTKPGPVAQRALDTFLSVSKKEKLEYNNTFKEILKFPYLSFFKKYAGPNDYLVLSFSAELYTKFICAAECFSCTPTMKHIFDEKNCLHWLYKDYLNKNEYLLPFDTKESLEWSFDLLVDFARDIYEIFQDRVVIVKTHFSNLVIAENLKVTKVEVTPKDLLFYRQTKIVSDPTDHKYAERLSEIIVNKFKHHYSVDVPLIKLDEPVFLDSNHKWGASQFHLDHLSRQKVARLIHKTVTECIAKKSFTYEQPC